MKKLLATLTTVAMLATTTAFAAPVANDKGYNKAAGTYSVAADLSDVEGQLTLLIIPEAAYQADEIKDEDILYIDQGAYANGLFQNVGILGGTELKPGNYYAKIGGKELDEIIVEKFTISSAPEYKLGDVIEDGAINVLDASAVLEYFVNIRELTEKQKLAANVVKDEAINVLDASAILEHFANIALIK